jgi:hypothetical protein
MATNLVPVRQPVSDGLHPLVYAGIVMLVLWFVFSIWAFGDSGYAEFLLAVVSGFFLMAAAIPFAIWRTWRKHSGAAADEGEPLRDWASHEFDIEPGRMKGKETAVEALLPIAAVAFGMTAFAIVLVLTMHHIV